jgi:hypothetical protein
MRAEVRWKQQAVLKSAYVLATVQFVWCYLWIARPYVSNLLYEQGRERMPFQGRVLMMLPMRWANHSSVITSIAMPLGRSHFWFPTRVAPEVLAQAAIDVLCLLLTGWLTTKIYQASSSRQLLTQMIYPLFLVVCGATYVMHTVQNFRFVYDLPSLAFFTTAMYLMYFRKNWGWFAAVFCIATTNRETTLLLLPLYMLNGAVEGGRFSWARLFRVRTLAVVLPLAAIWAAWQIVIRHHFAANPSELYPRINWNVKSLLAPMAWPQLFSAGGYLLVFVIVLRRRILDPRLRAWLWIVPVWVLFMFVYGILIETRVFGELIPLIVCGSAIIVEEILLARMRSLLGSPTVSMMDSSEVEIQEAA